MNQHTPCPHQSQLKELLDCNIPGEQQTNLVQHLDSCECCQHSLEAIAAEGSPCAEALRHLSRDEPPPRSAYWNALQAVQQEVLTKLEPPTEEEEDQEPVSLDFLSPADQPGSVGKLGHMNVIEIIGRGGMGLVLKAHDPCLDRLVAIKVLDPKLADNDMARKRFCREAHAAASVTHDNVVVLHYVDREEGNDLPYLVMQLVTGESLQERLDRVGPLSLKQVLRIGMQTAAGLAAAHAQGLIHRDIKPANILLEEGTDRVKLTDFGLARAAEDAKLTQTGFVAGTPLYMAPEQAKGEDLDHRTDLFSLGSVLYAMCTGRPPFNGSTPFVILRQVTEEVPRPIRDINPAIPEWLAAVIDKLQAKDPKDRFQSATEVAELFSQNLALIGVSADVAIPPAPAKRRPGASPRGRLLLLSGGVFVALVGALLTTELTGVSRLVPFLHRAEVLPRATLTTSAGPIWSVTFSPDGKTVAAALDTGYVRFWDAATGEPLGSHKAHATPVWAAAFSPDGQSLATGSDDIARIWDPVEWRERKELRHGASVRALAYSPDGKMLVTAGRDGSLRLWDVAAAKLLAEPERHESMVVTVAFSPNGRTIASAGTGGVVKLWDTATGKEQQTLRGHKGGIYGLAFSPDGKLVASGGWDHVVRIWDVASGEIRFDLPGHEQDVWSIAFSPDGKTLATGSEDQTVKLWDVAAGKCRATLRGHTATVYTVAFSPDGSTVASAGRDGTVKLWDANAK